MLYSICCSFLTLLLPILLAELCTSGDAQYRLKVVGFNAAACCARGIQCHAKHARLSGCKRKAWMYQQPRRCQEAACAFCKLREKRPVCRTYPIMKICFKKGPPYPRPASIWALKPRGIPPSSPSPSSTPAPVTCTHHGKDGVVNIGAKDFPIYGQWTREQKINNESGVVWKEGGTRKIDSVRNGDAFCVSFKPDAFGLYLFTVVSSAPQFTDHNDAWFKFPPVDVILFRPSTGSLRRGSSRWTKGFQNEGRNIMATYISTIDNNGHQIFLDRLWKGQLYRVCVAGRSSRFKLYNLVLIRCKDLASCDRLKSPVKDIIENLPSASPCEPV